MACMLNGRKVKT